MATLAELRAKVRSQTQTTDDELTDAEIDSWLQEAFDRTISAEMQWPFYEFTWFLILYPGETAVPLPSNPEEGAIGMNGVISLLEVTGEVEVGPL